MVTSLKLARYYLKDQRLGNFFNALPKGLTRSNEIFKKAIDLAFLTNISSAFLNHSSPELVLTGKKDSRQL